MSTAQVGVAVVDITPPPGLAMAGFVARGGGALGVLDPLTVRALVVDDTALVVADVIGLHEEACARIRARAALPAGNVVLAATHTHGGPVSMPRRVGAGFDPAYAARLEAACVEAIARAAAARQPAHLRFGRGADPGVARNRRHPGGVTDPDLPVLRFDRADGAPLALLVSYACHPVVLGPDNRLFSADYPGAVRRGLEAAHPGAVAVFATGCCGDANTGHGAAASLSSRPQAGRSAADAARHGDALAAAAMAAALSPVAFAQPAAAAEAVVALDLQRESDPPGVLLARWRAERAGAAPDRARLLDAWIAWAADVAPLPLRPWPARVARLRWGGVDLLALPGEVFAETGLAIKARAPRPTVTLAYAEGCPGYIAPRSEWPHGGYEVAEAHRFYGMPGPFAPGSAERLAEAAAALG